MAHHKSAKKRILQNEKKRLRNRYKKVSMRNVVRKLRETSDKDEATQMLPQVFSEIDKVAKSNIIHKNTASNMKSKLAKYVNKLG
ncbi:MAG: 30S ribosomal protein S20 [Bacteroidota bacterium]